MRPVVDPARRRFLQGLSLVPFAGCGPPPPEETPVTPPGETAFAHGVASGDPRAGSVTLWTRVSTPATGPVGVTWELAERADFAVIAARGEALADPAADRTVHVVARGLAPGRTYFYRFRALGSVSPVGRTRTAAAGRLDRLRLAVVSCNSKGHG